MGSFYPPSLEEVGRQNMAMMERAMSLFTPFLPTAPQPQGASPQEQEIERLRAEVAALRAQLGKKD
jgi:polyhydroxyalkanoate synthesis regulator protein